MPFTAGQKLRASQVQNIQPVVYSAIQTGNGGGIQALTTTETDLLACSVTFTTLTAAKCTVDACGHFLIQVGAASVVAVARLNVDGTTISPPELRCNATVSGTEVTTFQRFSFTLSGAGSHTVKMRGIKTGAGGTSDTGDTSTGFTLTVYEVV